MWGAALVYLVVSLVLWYLAGAVFMPEVLANRFFELLPVFVIEAGVQLLGATAKHAAFVSTAILYFGAYFWFAANWSRIRTVLGNSFYAGFILWGINVLALFPLTGNGVFGYKLPQGGFASSIFLFAAHWIFARTLQYQGFVIAPPASRVPAQGRRIFIAALGAAALAGLVRLFQTHLKPAKWSDPITPSKVFYTVSKNSVDPVLSAAEWRLEVRGLVDRPSTLNLDDIRNMPALEMVATLACISNPVGGPWIGNARWKGVPLASVLEAAGASQRTHDVVFHAADGYSDSIPIERAMHPFALLAYEMNEAPLTSKHGFPLRLIVPGIYGMKNVKWITAIEPVDHDYRGFWQTRGWDDAAPYKLMSRIDVARDGLVAGIAFAGDRGVRAVQVKVGDQPWAEATLEPSLSQYAWVRWSLRTDVQGKGIIVRMVSADGEAQIAQPRPPFPDGSSGLHTVVGS